MGEKLSLIDALTADFKGQEMRSREILLVVDGEELEFIVYWNPITLWERARIAKMDGNDGQVAGVLIMKALDADGNKLFKIEDKAKIKNFARPEIISALAAEMLLSGDSEDAEKN